MAKGTSLDAARQQATWKADCIGVTVVKYPDGTFGVAEGVTEKPLGRTLSDGSEIWEHHWNGGVKEQAEMTSRVFLEDDDQPSWGRK